MTPTSSTFPEREAQYNEHVMFSRYFSKFWVNHWNWKYGNCFTFNPGGNETGSKLDIFKTSKTGFHHGMFKIQEFTSSNIRFN